MKFLFLKMSIFILVSTLALAKVDVKMVEPMVFKKLNTEVLGTKVLARGIIEVSTDNKEEDFGKLLKFMFPKVGFITNKKHWLKVEGFYIERDKAEHIVTREKEYINFYGVIDRRDIGKWGLDPEIIEGDYIGYVPINIAQYGKLLNNIKVEN